MTHPGTPPTPESPTFVRPTSVPPGPLSACQPLADNDAALAWLATLAAPGAALRSDSRSLQPGDIFIAWPGLANDARQHVGDALRAGAAACLVDVEGIEAYAAQWQGLVDAASTTAPRIGVLPGLKAAAGALADTWLQRPSERLAVIATTGTNGKTSTAWWVAQALSLSGRRCGVIGTLGAGEPPTRLLPAGSVQATGFTTPDPVTLHSTLARFVDQGVAAAAIEASSIGLAEHRLDAARIRVALFTNLTPDHLDYHGDMAAYWAAKKALFDWPGLKAAVIDVDDAHGAALADEIVARQAGADASGAASAASTSATPEVWTCSRQRPARLQATALHYTATGLAFTVVEATGDHAEVQTQLIGDYNASNVLGVIGVLRALGLPLAQAAALAGEFTAVPGRMQRVGLASADTGQPAWPDAVAADLPAVVVDYAHTPDALEQALLALRPLARSRGGQLICAFGCGGNRDATKRPLMGAIAARLADPVVVTSDNPRHEDPAAIVAQVLAGCVGAAHVRSEVDRAAAIAQVITGAAAADVVLLAGKGHETEQEIAGVKRHFSDIEHAQAALARRAAESATLFTLAQAQALLANLGIAARLAGTSGDVGATAVQRVHSDTRTLRAGDLFVALRGERHDANDFLAQAQAEGASAALAERGLPDVATTATPPGAAAGTLPGLLVPDSLAALQQLAAAWRAGLQLPLIAVTGSNGKTTVTQMIAAILRAWHGPRAHATAGNYNNHIGVPLTLLALRRQHRASVVELGMNHPGEIAELAALAAPTVALVNNAQREHQEFMASVDAVAAENGSVISALPGNGVAVFPAGDAYSATWAALAGPRRVMRFWLEGTSTDAATLALLPPAVPTVTVTATHAATQARADTPTDSAAELDSHVTAEVRGTAHWQLDHWRLAIETPAGPAELALHIAGRHNARNALAATACALAAGCPLDAVVAGLQGFRPVTGRSQVERLDWPGGAVTLVNDSYNANPDSVRAAIDLLAELPAPRWLLLGDMGEVGEQGPAFHREVGEHARARGIERLWTAGELAAHAAQAYNEAAASSGAHPARHHADTAALVAALRAGAWPAAASVLVKGSRFMKMEQALAVLRQPTPGGPAADAQKGPAHAA